ncbi:MAG TPA: LysR substrate-binding domain-containing protein [Thermodesulfobacteriota bacterium]|nr:LysR substrate-binding domain-containing protein [Thermodesulfobacteriota bacterium]
MAEPLDLSFQQLRVFQAVARRLSYTQAAADLGRTQPAVSAQIRQLEARLGLDLFEQVGRRVHLTAAGRELLAAVQRLFAAVDDIAQLAAELKGVRRGSLRVGAVSTAGEYIVPPLLGIFHRQHPEVDVNLVLDNRAGILRRLYDNELDFAVMGRVPPGSTLDGEPVLPNFLVVVAPAGHPLARKRRLPLAALRDETWLMREEGSGTRIAVEAHFEEHGFAPTKRLTLSGSNAIKQAAAAGLGVAVLSRAALELELAARRLAILDVEGFPLERPWHIVQVRHKRLSPAAQAFQSLIRAAGRERWGGGAPPSSLRRSGTLGA